VEGGAAGGVGGGGQLRMAMMFSAPGLRNQKGRLGGATLPVLLAAEAGRQRSMNVLGRCGQKVSQTVAAADCCSDGLGRAAHARMRLAEPISFAFGAHCNRILERPQVSAGIAGNIAPIDRCRTALDQLFCASVPARPLLRWQHQVFVRRARIHYVRLITVSDVQSS
jgi:hypothetical protein